MNINFRKNGDDLFQNRLFVYLTKELNMKIDRLVRLRGNVFFVKGRDSIFILKGFNNLKKLKIQEAYMSSLRISGFNHACHFYLSGRPLFFQGMYYGCLEYIEPDEVPFHYSCEKDRKQGAELLAKYHEVSKNLASSYANMLPKVDTIKKWQERRTEFEVNRPSIQSFIPKDILADYELWSEEAIQGLDKNRPLLEEANPSILHGDVAHHNFLRARSGKLYLIDFDLISVGSPVHDFLQYANRILPFIDWNLEALAEIQPFPHLLQNKAFQYGLIYPADVFREWNRMLRGNKYLSAEDTQSLVKLTIKQFAQRKLFVEKLTSNLS